MYSGTYKIADQIIEIQSLHERVQMQCQPYRWEGPADFLISICKEDLDRERKYSVLQMQREHCKEIEFGADYLETLAVYRKMAEEMLRRNTLLFHGSVIAVDGAAYLFTAKSGTGKSTHTRLWREMLGERAIMVNDDKPMLKLTENEVLACGTPWNGKHQLGTNCMVPLKAICILERGAENQIRPISVKEAIPFLIQQSYRPESAAEYPKYLDVMDQLVSKISFYRLACNISREAARLSYQTLSKIK